MFYPESPEVFTTEVTEHETTSKLIVDTTSTTEKFMETTTKGLLFYLQF